MAEIRWRSQAEIDAEREAQALAALRAERDARLAACDWTQLPDVPLTPEQKAAWAAYRQALRDLPETTTDPFNPVWPVPI
ncbi:MAG: tail fiber assembly protein [Betaproteobacteria bacterium]